MDNIRNRKERALPNVKQGSDILQGCSYLLDSRMQLSWQKYMLANHKVSAQLQVYANAASCPTLQCLHCICQFSACFEM